jgi:hypothetical protein
VRKRECVAGGFSAAAGASYLVRAGWSGEVEGRTGTAGRGGSRRNCCCGRRR